MKLSKKAEYALRALISMARSTLGTTFSIQELARSEHIPLKFLEQILLALKNGGLLRSKRGVGGGYQLNQSADQITLGTVIELIDGPFEPIPCVQAAHHAGERCDCGIAGGCALGQSLAELRDTVQQWLSSTTIADIVARESARVNLSFEI